MKNLKEIGKQLSYLLRHNPETLVMDEFGYVYVSELIKYVNITDEELKTIVDTNNKKRFSFSSDGEKIRASQGHSIEGLNLGMKTVSPPKLLFHGTCSESFEKIKLSGISKMQRQYVHLTDNLTTAYSVGKRYSKKEEPIILHIDTLTMELDGFEFKMSENGVYQVDSVPFKYIKGTY